MTYLLQVSLPYYTGNAEDVVVNTFHFEWGGGSPPAGGAFTNLVSNTVDFYDTVLGGNDSTGCLYLAPWINPSNVRFTTYDLDDTPPRVPVSDIYTGLAATPSTNSALPLEAACVVSYRANYASGIPRARQRGRIYLGGFTSQGLEQGTSSSFPRFSATQISNIGSAASVYRTAQLADDWIWSVYSRVGATSYPIVAGWVDAEIDTQRRRGNVLTGTRDPWA